MTIINDFGKINPQDREAVISFIDEHFYEVGEELEKWVPDDWTRDPGFLERVQYREVGFVFFGDCVS